MMKRYRLFWALLVMPLLSFAESVLPPLTTGAPLIVFESQMPRLFKQCSRTAPTPDQILGEVTAAEMGLIETSLKRFFSTRRKAGEQIPPASVVYQRQYAAYLEGSTRKIYGNFFPALIAREVGLSPGGVMQVCDGGSVFWGIVYDPQSDKFEQLEFNGP